MRLVKCIRDLPITGSPRARVFYELHTRRGLVREVMLDGDKLFFSKFVNLFARDEVDDWEVNNRHQIKGIIALNGDNSA